LPYLREDKLAKMLACMREQNAESIQRMKMVWLDLAAMEQNMVAVFL
jgi:hypothetical protein